MQAATENKKLGAGDTATATAPARPALLASLRARLMLLVALALAPAFALTAWNHYEHLLDRQAEAQAAAQRIVHSRAKEFGEKIEDMKGLLGIVAGLPMVREDPRQPGCSEQLAEMRRHLPHIGNLGVALPDSTAACSSLPFDRAKPPSYADRLWFSRAMASGAFAVGEYAHGRLTNSHILAAGLPVKDAQGRVTMVVFAAMDLSWLSRFVADLPLPPDAALLVLDRQGRILARHPDHDAWVGKLHPQAAVLAAAATSQDGRVEHRGVDNVLRTGALAHVPGSDLTVYYGLPKATSEAEARKEFITNIALMAAILLASFALTSLVAERLVLRRARRLSTAAARLAAGDLAARSALADNDEIGRLGSAFDQMAEAVAGREQELVRRVAERTAELSRANDELARASRLKSDFLASMSHELRTPLNAIIGFSEVLHDGLAGEVSDQQREYLNDILSSGTHLLSLINDILDLSKVEAGKMELELEAVAVEPALRMALSIVREKAAAHHLTLETKVAPDVGELIADARKLKQIVFNLLSNAVKFTGDHGRVTLSARRAPAAAAPAEASPPPGTSEFVEIAVTDTGIGIAPADQARLFAAFAQIDSSLSRQYEGTGLGLALVKRLAELHGGAVGVESAPGQGSTFRVWLPCRPEADLAGPNGAPDTGPGSKPAPIGGGRRVLVVEDDALAFELLRLTLTQEGFVVTRAANATEMRRRLEVEMPDLITLDIMLPDENGWLLLDWLKANATLAHIPVVVISIVADQQKGFALGASAVLQKPFLKSELTRVLASLGFAPPAAGAEPAHVLVVDDDPLAVERLAMLLEADGHVVARAGGGREGVAQALAAPPDLILLDLMMPQVTGFDVVRQLRDDPRTRATPIVIVTAKLLDDAERRELDGQVLAVMHKDSFTAEAFLAEVRRALGRTGST